MSFSRLRYPVHIKGPYVVVLLLSHVQLFCDPMGCSLPGSSVHGISQARILEWVAISFSKGSSWPRDQTLISCIGKQILYLLSHQGSSKGSFRRLLMTLIFQDSSISPLTFSKWLTENFQISKLIAHSHFRFQSCSQRKLGLNPNHYTDYNDLGQATWPHWFSDLLSMKRR